MATKRRKTKRAGEIISERYLCLGSNNLLLCMDLTRTADSHGRRWRHLVEHEDAPEAHITCKLDLCKFRPPMGMRSTNFKFRNPKQSSGGSGSESGEDEPTIYLMGGEYSDPDYSFRSNNIYKVVVIPKQSENVTLVLEEADSSIPRMACGKGYPIVEEIGGNLYVLQTRSIHGMSLLPEPTFEVFDGQSRQWKTLKPPPIFDTTEVFDDGILAHVVLGHQLFVRTLHCRLLSFNTENEEWFFYKLKINDLRNCLPMKVLDLPSPFGAGTDEKQLFVGIRPSAEPTSFLFNSDGGIISCQSLSQIFQGMRPLSTHYATFGSALIPLKPRVKGIIRMCACACISAPRGRLLLVSFFNVQINRNSQHSILQMLKGERPHSDDDPAYTSFLHVRVEHSFVLRIPGVEDDFYLLNGPAFFL